MAATQVILVGKWYVGYGHNPPLSLLRFDFSDREPIVLGMSREEAVALANAILEQDKHPPPVQLS